MATVTHTFVSAITDDPAAATAGEVLPSHWNADHTVVLGADENFVTDAQINLIDNAVQPGDLAAVATSGDYDDLINKPTIPTGTIDGTLTTNELVYSVDANTVGSLAVATYPNLTEISYVKGVSGALQTQIDGKLASTRTKAQFDAACTDGNFIYSGDNVSSLTNDAGYVTATSSTAFTNKTGDISQWTNNSGYITNITGLIDEGSNVTITGTGTSIDPYVINAGSGGVAWGDITGTLSDQSDLQAALDGKVDENAAITGATKTKITYDAKGLVTAGADATTADIADSSNKRYVTDLQLTVIGNTSGTNTGDQTSVSGNAGTATALQNARTIGGVSFDGTSNITVASATGGFTVSGGDLALGANNLTMTGSLAATGARVTKGWFTDIESTNAPTIGGTAATGSGGLVRATSPTIVTPTIAKVANLTSNGFVKTSGGDGTLSVDTTSYQALDSTLTALAAYNTNGILAQTAADTFTGRTLTGTANQIAITNGNGVSGNPTFAFSGGALWLAGYASVNLNSVADTAITIILPSGHTNYRIGNVQAVNTGTTASLTTAQFGLFTSTGGGGVALVTSGTALTQITATGINSTANSFTYGPNQNYWTNTSTLYLRCTQAQGAAATANFYVYVYPLP